MIESIATGIIFAVAVTTATAIATLLTRAINNHEWVVVTATIILSLSIIYLLGGNYEH